MISSKIVAAGSVGAILGFVAGWVAAPSSSDPVEGPVVSSPSSVADSSEASGEASRTPASKLTGRGRQDDPRWNESDAEFYERRAEERRASRESMFRSEPDEEGGEGVSPAWNPYMPEVLRPGGFEEQVKRAVDECQPDMELVGFDCGEPPCLAIFRDRGGGEGALTSEDCPAWREPYGDWKTSSSDVVDCPDGVSERVLLLGSARTHDWVDEPDGAGRGNGMMRLKSRSRAVMEEWVCATD